MNAVLRYLLVLTMVLLGAPSLLAAEPGAGPGIGMGLSVLGLGVGLGLIGFAALSGMARQPEQAGNLRSTMLLLAALAEGAAIISLVLCLVVALAA